jgi:hypothetical protein
MVMLVFSTYLPSPSVITFFNYSSSTRPVYPTIPLHHLPEKILPFTSNSIFIYMWFYSLLFHSTLYKNLHHFIKQQHQQKYFYHSSKNKNTSLRHKYLYLLIYILFNLSLTSAVYYNYLPLHSLCGLPTILCISYCHHTLNTKIKFNSPLFSNPLSTFNKLPSLDLADNASKLAYLNAWQSIQKNSTTLMNFSPGSHPVCIDTGASSCISNNKSDFTDLQSSSHTVL